MNKVANNRKALSIVLPLGLLLSLLLVNHWRANSEGLDEKYQQETEHRPFSQTVKDKQKGAHVFGLVDSTNVDHLCESNLEWITLVSWINQDDYDSPLKRDHNGDIMRLRRNDSEWVDRIDFLQAKGFKVFLKPHIWVSNPLDGKWRADIFPRDQETWQLWKQNYRDYIIRFARIAEITQAELFCVGAELSRLTVEDPLFWKELIKEVRGIYSRKLTYAANWYEEYEQITFWDDLDYIGVQAYFPLTKTENPSVEQVAKGWDKYIPSLESISKKFQRPILFTEMGYKSTTDSAIKPWEWLETIRDEDKILSNETQANCYQAFFDCIWNNEWFAGVHIWQLRSDFGLHGIRPNMDFIPQGKPAQQIIAKGFE